MKNNTRVGEKKNASQSENTPRSVGIGYRYFRSTPGNMGGGYGYFR